MHSKTNPNGVWLVGLFIFGACAQELQFNIAYSNQCSSSPCNLLDASFWVPSTVPSQGTSLTVSVPVSLFTSQPIDVASITLETNASLSLRAGSRGSVIGFLNISGSSKLVSTSSTLWVTSEATFSPTATLHVIGGNVTFASSNISRLGVLICEGSSHFTCNGTCVVSSVLPIRCPSASFHNLVLGSGSELVFADSLQASSIVVQARSTAYFRGGLVRAVPLVEVGAGAVVHARRWFPITTLMVYGTGVFQVEGQATASVGSLIGNGTISLLDSSRIYIGKSFFSGTIRASDRSSLVCDGLTVNSTLLLDGSSYLNTTQQGLLLTGSATLKGGLSNSGTVSIFPTGSLSVSGQLELKANGALRLHNVVTGGLAPVMVNGTVVFGGTLEVTFASWNYPNNTVVSIPIISSTAGNLGQILGSFSRVAVRNAPNTTRSSWEFFVQVEDGTVSLVYGTRNDGSDSKYWEIIVGAVGGLVLVIVIVVVVVVRRRRRAQKNPENAPLLTS